MCVFYSNKWLVLFNISIQVTQESMRYVRYWMKQEKWASFVLGKKGERSWEPPKPWAKWPIRCRTCGPGTSPLNSTRDTSKVQAENQYHQPIIYCRINLVQHFKQMSPHVGSREVNYALMQLRAVRNGIHFVRRVSGALTAISSYEPVFEGVCKQAKSPEIIYLWLLSTEERCGVVQNVSGMWRSRESERSDAGLWLY